MEPESKLRWGILSTAKIARQKVIPAMQQGRQSEVVAIASRSPNRAGQAAEALGIDRAADSYEELLAIPEVDAVYNPLPNHLHVPWTIKALQAGKHVLCEKPLGLSAGEVQTLIDETKKYPELKVMEAFMYRFHPRWKKTKELVQSGALGRLDTIRSFFSYFNDDPDNIRNKPQMGGGGLMDIGCYCISVARYLFGEQPSRVTGMLDMDPDLKVDRHASGMMEFPGGSATFTCATQLAPHQSVTVFGTEGKIEMPMPFNPPVDEPTALFLETGKRSEEMTFAPCNQYTLQGDSFSRSVLNDTAVPTPLEDALANMQVLEAIRQSSETGRWAGC